MTSKYARKQRKALYNAPNHVRNKSVGSHLSEELTKKLGNIFYDVTSKELF